MTEGNTQKRLKAATVISETQGELSDTDVIWETATPELSSGARVIRVNGGYSGSHFA